jgi:hypothetical protein
MSPAYHYFNMDDKELPALYQECGKDAVAKMSIPV